MGARIAAGAVNAGVSSSSRSFAAILRANVLTRFNALLGGMLVVILVIGPIQDALFGIILVVNTAIGVGQELRARQTLDKLALLHAPRARVVRDGTMTEIAAADVVVDDLLELARGDQVVVDGVVIEASGLEVDESLLTGEADAIAKAVGASILSGSAVIAGSARMRATAVGGEAFAQSLAAEAKKFSLVHSELQTANNQILRVVTWAIVPVAGLLCWSQLTGSLGVRDALRGSVAGVANMIPEGLILLTTVAYAMGALRLARRGVLVRELAAVEGLARVDVLCIDKTGTLTTGEIRALEVRQVDPEARVEEVLAGLAAAEDAPTASLAALAGLGAVSALPHCLDHIPFSSERRWSAATFEGLGSYVLGAPEALLQGQESISGIHAQLLTETAAGHRVLVLARARDGLTGEQLPASLEPVAVGVLAEDVRPDAAATLAYLRAQGVAVKVISGDNPTTVAGIAARAGLENNEAIDAAVVLAHESPGPLLERHSIFGRVGPREKRAMIAALQANGHVVAMTGDGVNDVLALRDADLGIAMGSGSPAARAAARVVLLNNAFAILPDLLAEGRRVLANVERVSKLFVSKTVYAALIALTIAIVRVPYPFYPRNFTVISSLTIGIPALFLALPRATTRLRAGYLRRVTRFVVPTGVVIAAATICTYLAVRSHSGSTSSARSAATTVLGAAGLWVLGYLARPFTWWKFLLVGAMAGLFAVALLIPAVRHVLALAAMSRWSLTVASSATIAALLGLGVLWHLQRRRDAGDAPSNPFP